MDPRLLGNPSSLGMVPHNPWNEPSRPPKFRSVSHFYFDSPKRVHASDASTGSERWNDDDDDDGDDAEEKSRLVKKRKVSTIQQEQAKHGCNHGTGTSTGFRTLAQLLEPQRNVRIKSYPGVGKRRQKTRATCMANRVKRFYTKSRYEKGKYRGNIGLVVDLIFEKDVVDDGVSSSDCPLSTPPAVEREDSIDEKSVEACAAACVEEEEGVLDALTDPLSLTIARLFTQRAVESIAVLSPFRSQIKWREIDVGYAEPTVLMNRECKVYCAVENKWFSGFVSEYDHEHKRHLIKYDAKKEQWHLLVKERMALNLSLDEKMSLLYGQGEVPFFTDWKNKTEELLVFAASIENLNLDRVFNHGDIVWGKSPGYPMWPAFVMDEQHAKLRGADVISSPNTTPVHYFGSHEIARINSKQVMRFSKGLVEDFHLRCSRIAFFKGLEEVDRYFKERKLPETMSYLQSEVLSVISKNKEVTEDDEDFVGDERKHKIRKSLESIFKCPIKLGSLRLLSLGKIVKDSEYFHDQHYIWTEGYTSVRKFFSMKDPSKMVNYKMEILRNPNARTMPLFRVAPDDWEQHRWRVQVLQHAGRRYFTSCKRLEKN